MTPVACAGAGASGSSSAYGRSSTSTGGLSSGAESSESVTAGSTVAVEDAHAGAAPGVHQRRRRIDYPACSTTSSRSNHASAATARLDAHRAVGKVSTCSTGYASATRPTGQLELDPRIVGIGLEDPAGAQAAGGSKWSSRSVAIAMRSTRKRRSAPARWQCPSTYRLPSSACTRYGSTSRSVRAPGRRSSSRGARRCSATAVRSTSRMSAPPRPRSTSSTDGIDAQHRGQLRHPPPERAVVLGAREGEDRCAQRARRPGPG